MSSNSARKGRPESSLCVCQHVPVALKIDVLEVTAALDAVEVAVRAVLERLSVDGMFELCSNALAGRTGRE